MSLSPITTTTIIFDWDDTFLCSHLLFSLGYGLGTPQPTGVLAEELKLYAKAAITTLETASKYGKVVIVTNAEDQWVQRSAQHFLPALVPHLDKVTIISACTKYRDLHPGKTVLWKYLAFKECLGIADTITDISKRLEELKYEFGTGHTDEKSVCRHHNVLSFGDSLDEMTAITLLGKETPNMLVKSVKFEEQPKRVDVLVKQHQMVAENMAVLINHPGSINYKLTVTLAEPIEEKKPQPIIV